MTEILNKMTPEHPTWREFYYRLKEARQFSRTSEDRIETTCDSTKNRPNAWSILVLMGFSPEEIVDTRCVDGRA
jgi:hypothetical protein